jgi:hypothetical protein
MPDEILTELEEDSAIDETSLAGLSEYSATGGGGQPVHVPRMSSEHELFDEPEVPDGNDFRELYRYSLGRATQDADDDGWDEDGSLHVVSRSAMAKQSRER